MEKLKVEGVGSHKNWIPWLMNTMSINSTTGGGEVGAFKAWGYAMHLYNTLIYPTIHISIMWPNRQQPPTNGRLNIQGNFPRIFLKPLLMLNDLDHLLNINNQQ